MIMTTDAVLIEKGRFYDIDFDDNGDILTDDFFDTAIKYSLFGERRASGEEMQDPRLRRGWIGNQEDFENGSKLWLLQQSRLTKDLLNRISYETNAALKWLVDDGYAVSIDTPTAIVKNGSVFIDITIRRSYDRVERRFFKLWEGTGGA